jgi:hypothetical protein
MPNVMMSHAVAWRGGCAAASVTSNRIGSIYWLGSVYYLEKSRESIMDAEEAETVIPKFSFAY